MGRLGGIMGRLGGEEPGGVARRLLPGCTGVDLVLAGGLEVGGDLDVAGALELVGAFKHGTDTLWVPAAIGDSSDGSATLTAGQYWTMPVPLPVGKRLNFVYWIWVGASTGTKTMSVRQHDIDDLSNSSVDNDTSTQSGLRHITQTVTPAEDLEAGVIYTLRFTAGNDGDVLWGAGLEFIRP